MTAYYNEIDPAAAHVLRTLIADGVVAPGDVDTRSIKEVQPDDVRGYTQCHWFAGGALWSVAARMAGWPDDRPLWTASCPCQPFSVAGKGAGADDPRHLWPDVYRVARARRPSVLVGEQVAQAAGYGWFDGVSADLEGEGYACRAVDFPACTVDAPHIRNRLYWVALADAGCVAGRPGPGDANDRAFDANLYGAGSMADANRGGRTGRAEDSQRGPERRAVAERPDDQEHATGERRGEGRPEPEVRGGRATAAGANAPGVAMGDALGAGLEGQRGYGDAGGRPLAARPAAAPDGRNGTGDLADASSGGRQQGQPRAEGVGYGHQSSAADGRNGTYWSDHEWIICHDGKARRTKPGLRLLVDGLPGRVDLWRVGGNAIVPQAAAEVLRALMDVLQDFEHARNPGAVCQFNGR